MLLAPAGSVSFVTWRRDDLIAPDETAFRLDLTPAQLKITHSALKSMLTDFGHDQPDVHRIIREVLAKLPDEASIRAIAI